jgi:crotonobetainyl-CoA:carnitine CoA-transferase CaiB-like acyl-CoA transferase
VMRVFEEFEVAAAPIYSIDQLVEDPHVKDREMFVRVKDDELGDLLVQQPVTRLSGTPAAIDHLGPPLGSSTDEILGPLCDATDNDLADLRERGIV